MRKKTDSFSEQRFELFGSLVQLWPLPATHTPPLSPSNCLSISLSDKNDDDSVCLVRVAGSRDSFPTTNAVGAGSPWRSLSITSKEAPKVGEGEKRPASGG